MEEGGVSGTLNPAEQTERAAAVDVQVLICASQHNEVDSYS